MFRKSYQVPLFLRCWIWGGFLFFFFSLFSSSLVWSLEVSFFPLLDGVDLVHLVQDDAPYIWVALHQNEETAYENLLWALDEFGGQAFFIENASMERNIRYCSLTQECFSFDPNRIFSYTINEKRELSPVQKKVLEDFSFQLITNLSLFWDSSHPVIALHNSRIDSPFSIESYVENSSSENSSSDSDEGDSSRLSRICIINNEHAPKDFILVTEQDHYLVGQDLPINLILEADYQEETDDGSLSMYAMRHHLPYLNIESAFNHKEEQRHLIQQALQIIDAASLIS